MTGLSKPYRRALALTLLAFGLFNVLSIVVGPWLGGGLKHAADIERLSSALRARQIMVERIPVLEARLAELKKDPQSGKRLLDGANATLAAASLQSQVRSILVQSNASVMSVEGLNSEPEKPLQHVSTRVVFRGGETILRNVLHRLETAVPFLYVDRLTINTTGGKVADTKSAASHLVVTLEVFGYWRPEADTADPNTPGSPATKNKPGAAL